MIELGAAAAVPSTPRSADQRGNVSGADPVCAVVLHPRGLLPAPQRRHTVLVLKAREAVRWRVSTRGLRGVLDIIVRTATMRLVEQLI